MKLEKHLSQGQLVYLSQDKHAITVSENDHVRWLAFDDVVQSVMLKRHPWTLTLPHQTAMMMPLLFFKPINIAELGLGGGNFARFLMFLSSDISIQSIENNKIVIDCFEKYFNPEKKQANIVNMDSEIWLQQANVQQLDWLICDIYQQQTQSFQHTFSHFEFLLEGLNNNACLTINLPDASDEEVNLSLTVLQQVQTSHNIFYFHIPNYLNIIIHLIPKHWNIEKMLKRNKQSYLTRFIFSRWQKHWLHGSKAI